MREVMNMENNREPAGEFYEKSLGPSDSAPDFTLPDGSGRMFNLKETLARGPVVLVVYRGHW